MNAETNASSNLIIIEEEMIRTAAAMAEPDNAFIKALALADEYKKHDVSFYYLVDFITFKVYVLSQHLVNNTHH